MATTTKKPATKTVKKPAAPKAETSAAPKAAAKTGKYFYANGKRKTSVARVRLYKGTGEISINDRSASEYLTVKTLVGVVKSPFKLTGNDQKYDVVAKVIGGGLASQADAIRHGIAKALITADPINKGSLKKAGMLTRDSRTKERKKYGLKRARKGPQFSKR